ncbi:DUF2939 domain-containing protein [Brevundimonas faecalis]|uniref:DUF2939 domain-containing protein n=1 Tax=Brevundimonas faecalis TaxID=947378 RepID=A0ABV2RHJ7_9CAUL
MNRKLMIRLGIGAAGLFVAAYGLSPLLAAKSLVQAAKAGDETALERKVDFPAFRQSLKDELNAQMMAEMRKEAKAKGDDGLAALGMLLGPAIVGGAVDVFVTPQAISMMVKEGQAPGPDLARSAVSPPKPKDAEKVRQSWGYRDLDTFAVTLTKEDKPDEKIALLMKRRNLFSWKLAAADLGDPE